MERPIAALDALNDGLPPVRSASFVPLRTLQAWHAAHPEWPFIEDTGVAHSVTFRNVWFSTRPGDDVFQGDPVEAKLGPTAFATCAVTIDYVHDSAGFECGG